VVNAQAFPSPAGFVLTIPAEGAGFLTGGGGNQALPSACCVNSPAIASVEFCSLTAGLRPWLIARSVPSRLFWRHDISPRRETSSLPPILAKKNARKNILHYHPILPTSLRYRLPTFRCSRWQFRAGQVRPDSLRPMTRDPELLSALGRELGLTPGATVRIRIYHSASGPTCSG